MGGHEENCQDSLANAPSVGRESDQGPASQQELQALQSESNKIRVSLLVNKDTVPWEIFPKKEICPETVHERVRVSASKFLDGRQGFSCR